jgi:putative membrane protein
MRSRTLLPGLILLYAAARVSQAYPNKIPMAVIVALHVLPPLLFALVHGALCYGPRGILVFTGLTLIVGNLFENLSVLTGFPFGHYHFTEVMGPKIFQIPILLGLAYVGMGYLSWTLGLLIIGAIGKPLIGHPVLTIPVAAAFVMVAWDLSMDPIWSNFVHGWVWHNGGAYFGVPASNFLGWYLTVYVVYQLFALYLRGRSGAGLPVPSQGWKLPVIFYGVSAAGNLLVVPPGVPVVTDAAGTVWRVSSIMSASAIVSVLVMGAFTAIAWVRMIDQINGRTDPAL